MDKAQRHPQEAERLASLSALGILDTPAEERFDRYTRLARRLFQVPVSLICLVDERRVWLKSCFGLEVSEIPRDISFCGHALLGGEPLVVPDSRMDPRFYDNPLATGEPHIRFYAGYPLRFANGLPLGTLCLVDQQPRRFGAREKALLAEMAGMVEQELTATQLATVDPLTRLSNRFGFDVLATHSLSLCRRKQMPACLISIDLDNFSRINEHYGRQEGDYALKVVAEHMQEIFRNSDVLARLSGDAFVVLLTNCTLAESREAILRFEHALTGYNQHANRRYELFFSFGISEFKPQKQQDLDRLLADSNSLMSQAKLQKKTVFS